VKWGGRVSVPASLLTLLPYAPAGKSTEATAPAAPTTLLKAPRLSVHSALRVPPVPSASPAPSASSPSSAPFVLYTLSASSVFFVPTTFPALSVAYELSSPPTPDTSSAPSVSELELELELIQTHMAQKLLL